VCICVRERERERVHRCESKLIVKQICLSWLITLRCCRTCFACLLMLMMLLLLLLLLLLLPIPAPLLVGGRSPSESLPTRTRSTNCSASTLGRLALTVTNAWCVVLPTASVLPTAFCALRATASQRASSLMPSFLTVSRRDLQKQFSGGEVFVVVLATRVRRVSVCCDNALHRRRRRGCCRRVVVVAVVIIIIVIIVVVVVVAVARGRRRCFWSLVVTVHRRGRRRRRRRCRCRRGIMNYVMNGKAVRVRLLDRDSLDNTLFIGGLIMPFNCSERNVLPGAKVSEGGRSAMAVDNASCVATSSSGYSVCVCVVMCACVCVLVFVCVCVVVSRPSRLKTSGMGVV
jgi:hypothetical protein